MPHHDLVASDINAYLALHERKGMLRLLTCGSVDDGKSTLIGRLMYDTKMVFEDQLEALRKDSARHGTTGDDFDPALLTDGLKAEREQGITIDVAYRYFSSDKRKFIIADCPGHEQYTRNMATGASNCDLAIILIDARHGVLTQTKRHSFICSLLGIKHLIVAVNKMDLVDYDEQVFEKIRADYNDFAAKLSVPDITFVPMSALKGENVVNPSEHMPWYQGATLMHLLDNITISADRNLIDMRFPVQLVLRPNLNFRGFSGTVASGILRPGDPVLILPSRTRTKIKSIVTMDGELKEAFPPQAVTVTTTEEVDISRGDMLVHPGNVPHVGTTFDAMVVWMNATPLTPHKQYLIKHTTRLVPGMMTELRYRMDINNLHRQDADRLEMNEIGRASIELAQPVMYDAYRSNRTTGAFVIIDRMTNNTVGAGMILERASAEDRARHGAKRSVDVETHQSLVSPSERQDRLGQKPATVWLTGLTGAGKSAVAYALERRLFDEGKLAHVIDGRNARLGLNVDLDFSPTDRAENLRRAAEVARLFNQSGLIAICAFLSPSAEDRAHVREIISGGKRQTPFFEVYLNAPEEVARDRRPEAGGPEDPKTLRPFADLQAPYQPPTDAELELPTHELSVAACVDRIMELLRQQGVI